MPWPSTVLTWPSPRREIFCLHEEVSHELATLSREYEHEKVLAQFRHHCKAEAASEPWSEPATGSPALHLVGNGAPLSAPKRDVLSDAELIDRYVQHMRRCNLSPTTIQQFSESLRLFAKEHEGSFATMTRASVDALLDARAGLHGATSLTPGRRYWLVSCLHGFYAWAIDQELLESDPTAKISRPKLTKKSRVRWSTTISPGLLREPAG